VLGTGQTSETSSWDTHRALPPVPYGPRHAAGREDRRSESRVAMVDVLSVTPLLWAHSPTWLSPAVHCQPLAFLRPDLSSFSLPIVFLCCAIPGLPELPLHNTPRIVCGLRGAGVSRSRMPTRRGGARVSYRVLGDAACVSWTTRPLLHVGGFVPRPAGWHVVGRGRGARKSLHPPSRPAPRSETSINL